MSEARAASSAPQVLIVDDERDLRDSIRQTLDLADIEAQAVGSVDAALPLLGPGWSGAVICDVLMPGRDGFALLADIARRDPDLPVVMLTGHGDVPMAVRAMQMGAYEFLEKPAAPQRLVEVIRRALEKRRLVLENRALRTRLEEEEGASAGEILGDAPSTTRFRERLARVAAADVDVLILGETGAGKELTARALHRLSNRAQGRFVAINCGALPAELAESELFGHEAGAFTGAGKKRIGKFAFANGGVVFLDEIESMAPALQVKLLRVLQEREVEPVGANSAEPLDIRVFAATKVDLKSLAEQGGFREDLYYRLDVGRLEIPPLRDRIEDAPTLFRHFAAQAAARRGLAPREMTAAARDWVLAQRWPGNVRELKNAAERWALDLPIDDDELDGEPPAAEGEESLAARVDAFEKRLLEETLRECKGRLVDVCERLGLPRNTLYDKMKKHGLARGDFA